MNLLLLTACDEEVKNDEPICYVVGDQLICNDKKDYIDPVTQEPAINDQFGTGAVAEFNWEKTIAWFLQSNQHVYGFDLDPFAILPDYIEKGKDVYVSVKTGEMASIRVRVDSESKKDYRLHKIDGEKKIIQENIFTGLDICEEDDCIKEIQLPAGDYAVYYNSTDKKRYLHVIEYDEKTKKIVYVQFGDENEIGCNNGSSNGCYTLEKVRNRFNEIFKQAVAKGTFEEKSPKDFNLDDILSLDLSENKTAEDYSKSFSLLAKMDHCLAVKEAFKEQLNKNEDDDDYIDVHNNFVSLYNSCVNYHTVFALNRMIIYWKIPKIDGEIVLENYRDFNKACTLEKGIEEKIGCISEHFLMYLGNDCGDTDKKINVIIKRANEEDNNFTVILEGAGTFKSNCKYTLYADVHPFVPGSKDGVQIHYYASESKLQGGIVLGAHVNGAASLNTIVHEIGHSFGLTDLFIPENDPTIQDFGFSVTNESNLMYYAVPTGPKLRYRPLEIVLTGTDSRIVVNGEYETESQWECIQSIQKCSKLGARDAETE